MKKRIVPLLFAVLFMALCLIPAAGTLLLGPAGPGANEVLSPRPSLTDRDGHFNGSCLSDAAAWLGDHFCLRQECVTAWARLNALLGSSVAEDVVLGREGWLYYGPTLADYTRTEPMTDRELWCAARTLYLLQEHARASGADFLFTVAPNKNSLYAWNMPDLPVANRLSNAEALSRLLREMDVAYLDLFAVFENEPEVLYFPTDSHWNGRGAALAADAILAALDREGGFYEAAFLPGEHRGDLYEMLYPTGKSADPDYIYAPGFTFSGGGKNPDAITITTSCPGGSGSLVMYRDSFGRNLYPYLAERFESARFSRKNDYGSLELSPGDTVIAELVERNLRYLIDNPPTLPGAVRDAAEVRDAVPAGTVPLAAEEDGGTLSLRGRFGEIVPDRDSPVLVLCSGTLYEAVPGPEGFRLCLTGADLSGGIRVFFTAEGNLTALEGVIENR